MSSNEQIIATFQTRVRDLLHQFQELKKENQSLYEMVEKNEQDIKDLQAKLTQADHDYQSLKMAKMIRDVNKCIALLSDEDPNQ